MCGIAGVRRYADNPITAEEVKVLLCSLERRGNHATGIALMTPTGIQIHKAPVPAFAFIGQKDTEEFLDEHLPEASIALLHTRFATIGDPGNNDNNHPFFVDNTAIVHNGSIRNHDTLFNSERLTRSCETDSDIIRAILDKEGITEGGIKTLNRMAGSAAVAAFNMEEPDKLLLARSGSPLVYGTAKDKLWWASELQAIQKAVRPWTMHHGLHARLPRTDVSYFSMPDHTAYVLSTTGLDLRREFKVCTHYTAPVYTCNTNYADKQKSFKEMRVRAKTTPVIVQATQKTEAPNTVNGYVLEKSAPCPKCGTPCSIPRDRDWKNYTCADKQKCRASLGPVADYPVHKISYGRSKAVN